MMPTTNPPLLSVLFQGPQGFQGNPGETGEPGPGVSVPQFGQNDFASFKDMPTYVTFTYIPTYILTQPTHITHVYPHRQLYNQS